MNHFFDTPDMTPARLATAAYGRTHWCWLLAFAVLAAGATVLYCHLDDRRRDHMRLWCGGAAAALELFRQVCLIAGGLWYPAYLPVCFCSLGLFFVLCHALRGSETVGNLLFALLMPMAFFGLMAPYWLALPGKNALFIYYCLSHILIFTYGLMIAAGGTLRPKVRYIPKISLLCFCLCLPLFCLNLAMDTNFLFLASPPEGTLLQWFTLHCGAHLVGYPIIMAALFALTYGISALIAAAKRPQ